MTELIIGAMITAVIVAIIIFREKKNKKEDEFDNKTATDLPLPPKPPTGTPK